MAEKASVRESAIRGETVAEKGLIEALDRLHSFNNRLFELVDEIRAAQPKIKGAVLLELIVCGSALCSGCPHPRWMKYRFTEPKDGSKGVPLGVNLGALKKDPVLAVARSAPYSAQVKALIREGKAIHEKRAKLIAAFRAVRNTSTSFSA